MKSGNSTLRGRVYGENKIIKKCRTRCVVVVVVWLLQKFTFVLSPTGKQFYLEITIPLSFVNKLYIK